MADQRNRDDNEMPAGANEEDVRGVANEEDDDFEETDDLDDDEDEEEGSTF